VGQSAAANPDVMVALLTEVRGLRAAMEQMASAGPRVQLAMGRLQLQEQRLNTMLRRLDDLHERIAGAEGADAQHRADLARLEDAAQHASDPPERLAVAERVRELKTIVTRGAAEIQRLQSEETVLSGNVAAEQARWVDINQRLEELDRSLGRR
jgi:chromosome segregation ATPase